MHRCLSTREIFLHIFTFLKDGRDTSFQSFVQWRRDLAKLARTCKAFASPALDLLWRDQTSLAPLVMLLPSHLWKRDEVHDEIYFVQQPRLEDWDGLCKYSQRIRWMTWPETSYLPRLGSSILEELLSPQVFRMLFPSLEVLNFSAISVPHALPPLLPGLLSSSFVQLWFDIPRHWPDDTVAEFLNALPVYATSLRELRITWDASSLAKLQLPEHHWPHLHTLMLSSNVSIAADSLGALKHLQNLRELSFRLPDDSSSTLPCLAQPGFTALERLTIAARSLDQCSDLLSNVDSRRFGYLSIAYDTQATDQALHAFLCAILSFHDRTPSFHTFILLHSRREHPSIMPPFVMSPSTLAPLLACYRLRVLELIDPGALDLDDEFLAKAAREWPTLRVLRLTSVPWFVGHRVTVAGIRELVRRCPHLKRLHLAFDGASSTNLDMIIDVDKGIAARKKSLEEINVCNSLIGDPHAMARFLASVAPKLKTLTTTSGDKDTRMKWTKVQNLLICDRYWGYDDVMDYDF